MPYLSYLILKMRKMGHLKKKHVIKFKTEKEPKMEVFDFGAFNNTSRSCHQHISSRTSVTNIDVAK